jgi:AcrR family transcriptional regulator
MDGVETCLPSPIGLFAARGYDSVSIRQIANAARVTNPQIYRRFSDKRTLYLSACGSVLGTMASRSSIRTMPE